MPKSSTCSICGLTYSSLRALKSHQRKGTSCRNQLKVQGRGILAKQKAVLEGRGDTKGKGRLRGDDGSHSGLMETIVDQALEPGPSHIHISNVEDQDIGPSTYRPKRDIRLPKRFMNYTDSEFIDELPPPPPPPIISNYDIPLSNTGEEHPQVAQLSTEPNAFGVYNQYIGELPSYNPGQFFDSSQVSDSPNFMEARQNAFWWSSTSPEASGINVPFFTPFENATSYRIMEWLYNGSTVKSNTEVDKLVHKVIQADDFNREDLRGFRCTKENERMDNWEDEPDKPFGVGSGWKESSVKIRVPCEKVKSKEADVPEYEVTGVFYREPLEVIKSALREPSARSFHLTPYKTYWKETPDSPPERIYSEIYNSDAFIQENEKIKSSPHVNGCTLETFIASICLWSDSTHLANFGDASLWPLYLYLGNQTKYDRNKLSTLAAHHIAYIPKLGDSFQDWYTASFGIAASASVVTHCRRELMHAILLLIFGDAFQEAYRDGIIFTFYDNIVRRMFPRFFIYGMDYPEKVLIALIRYFGKLPCPRCLVSKSDIFQLGTLQDWITRTEELRVDTQERRSLVEKARRLMFQKGMSITSTKIEKLLAPLSLVPVRNAFSTLFFDFGLDFYSMITPDLLHEFELGVWKRIFIHLMRILVAAGGDRIQELNKRFRMVPTFGYGTIQRFRSNPSEMKKLAGRDFEDLLQCSLPVFEGLLPPEHDKIVTNLIFELATWHGLAKLRMHTEFTLKALEGSTRRLGKVCRKFKETTCKVYETHELPQEAATRTRQQARKTAPDGVTTHVRGPKKIELNLNTIKFHALGDYVGYIRKFGTTDNYSTQTGESEHRRVKCFYTRTQKRQFVKGISKQQQRQRILSSIAAKDPLKLKENIPQYPSSSTLPNLAPVPNEPDLPPAPAKEHHQISSDTSFKINLTEWLHSNSNTGDPALKDFVPKLRRHLLMRIIGPKFYDRSNEEAISEADSNSITILDNTIYSHQRLRVNYTTYDLRREQDSINPKTHSDIMLLSEEVPENNGSKWHPYWYARVIGIYHARVYFRGLKSHPNIRPGQHSIHFLFVRWFGIDVTHECGWIRKHLPMLGFSESSDPDAVGFVNPAHVLRGAHLIPAFHFGRTSALFPPTVARLPSEEHEDWLCFYVNIFVDRDMLMRYRGGGVGHMSTRNATNIFRDDVDPIDDSPRSIPNLAEEYIAQLQRNLGDEDELVGEVCDNDSDDLSSDGNENESNGSDNESIGDLDDGGGEYLKLIYQLGFSPL